MTKIGFSARRPRAVHPHFCLRFCGAVFMALAWLAVGAAQAQTLGTASLLVGPAVGTNSVVLAVTSQTAWTATANTNWLQLNAANQSGQGSTNVVFTFAANTNSTRSGTLTIAGQTLTVTQAGAAYVAAEPVAALVSSGLNEPYGVAVDTNGNVYIADTYNNAIKEWPAAGGSAITLVSSNLNHPIGVAVDGAGNVYIADTDNSEIKEWSFANNSVTPLVSSGLLYPYGVAVDGAGNVYIADTFNNEIKEWSSASRNVTTLEAAGLNEPHGVAVDGAGNVYIADTGNGAIKEWSVASRNVTTVVSSGLSSPSGVAVDGAGNVYIADTLDNAMKERQYAFVDPAPKMEGQIAGNDALPAVLPATQNLLGPFAPASDASWLTISNTTDGVVSFSFTLNTSGASRMASIALLGQSIPVTQSAQPPTVTTQAATNITSTNATLIASVNPQGAAATVYFVYGPTTNYGSNTVAASIGSGTNSISVSNVVTGLLPATEYHFEAVATNGAGTNFGGDSAFTTQAGAPLATTQPATAIGSSNATLNATVTPEGAVTSVYFAYGPTTNYGSTTVVTNIGSGTNPISVSASVKGLVANTLYYFQVIANNGFGTAFGADLTFTNLAGAPLANTLLATAITSSNATLNASVNPLGATTTVYFVYGTNTNYGGSTVMTNIGSGTNAVSVSNLVTGLLPATNYHFEVIASNIAGVSFGGDVAFTDPAGAPLATTLYATSVNFGDATLYASVNPQGSATTVYFVYGTNTNYGNTNIVSNIGGGISNLVISNLVTGLMPATLYHFEAIASNSVGIALGGDVTFTNSSPGNYSLGTTSLVEGPAEGTNSVVLAVRPQTAPWTATNNAAWLHLTAANQGGTGSANVVFTFDANTTNATRSNTLTIAGQTLTVTQAGSNYVAAQPLTTLASSALADPFGVAVDTNGNVYFADTGSNSIKKWTAANNTVTTLVSIGLDQPWGVAVDGAGNVFLADSGNNAIKKWTAANASVTTLVSNGLAGPRGVAVDGAGNVYIANTGSNEIMEWTAATSNVTSLLSANLHNPSGVAVDAAGNVYVSDTGANQIQEWMAATSNVTYLISSNLESPSGVAVDGAGNVYVANTGSNSIVEWAAGSMNLLTLVSNGLAFPSGVAVDGAGNVYIANTGGDAIEELPYAFVAPAPRSEGNAAGSDQLPVVVPATANLSGPFAPTNSNTSWLTISNVTNGVVSFSFANNTTGSVRVNYITLLGQVISVTQSNSTFSLGAANLLEGPAAGSDSVVLAVNPNFGTWTGTAASNATWLHLNQSGTGSMNVIFTFDANPGATRSNTLTIAGQTLTVTQAGSTYVAAQPLATLVSNLDEPYGVAVDSRGNVFIADSGYPAIMEWTPASDTLTNLVSSGLSNPRGVAVDGADNLYISDYANNAIYEWPAASHTLTNLVSSQLFNPFGLAVDGADNIYIADYGGLAIKEYSVAQSNLTTLVSSELLFPSGVAVDAAGNVYITDTGNNVVKKWTAANSNVTVLVSGLAGPSGVAVDGSGNIYIADTGNHAVKKWTAASGNVTTLVSNLAGPSGVAVDASGNVYIADTAGNAIDELPYAFVDTSPRFENNSAGSDQLPTVLPAAANLSGPFTPASSDTDWLTINLPVANGEVSFSFAANTNPATNRIAYINLLNQAISITQGTVPFTNAMSLVIGNLRLLGNGVLQFTFTNNPNATFTVLSTTNLALPLADWTTVLTTNGAFQFTSPPTTNDVQLFYVVRSP